ncbi:SHOCT domain-containing protein [Alicyclobacillus acidiphilus]|uniref:SHOCT domain-containing protein n=1 Tax=Alicyclobacillus acidiphilus TaxID=182455 RepID=UPI000829CE03
MWWGHPYGFGFFPLVFPFGFFFFVALCFIVSRIVCFRRFRHYGYGCGGPTYRAWSKVSDPEIILKRRLAKGDITEEEYRHLRETLRG